MFKYPLSGEVYMKKFALIAISLLILVGIAGFTSHEAGAIDDSYVIINVTHYGNFEDPNYPDDNPDMSDRIFVGNSSEEAGRGYLVLQLTDNGEPIIDLSEDYFNPQDDFPGIHILRGADENGSFIQFNSHGFNNNKTREDIIFEISLVNAVIAQFGQVPIQIYDLYEGVPCGVDKNNPENSTGVDTVVFDIGGTEAELCGTTGSGADRGRIYYNPQDMTAPEIEITDTDPNMPYTNFGGEKNISIHFTSSEFPIDVDFRLLNSTQDIIDVQGTHTVNNESEIPLIYTLPGDLALGDYQLWMIAEDPDENAAEVLVGDIRVRDERTRSGGDEDDEDDNDGIVIFDEDLSLDVKRIDTGINDLLNDPISLNGDYEKESGSWGAWIIVIIIVDFILLLIILAALGLKR